MLIGCVADRSVSYARRVLRGIAGFVQHSPELEMENISPQDTVSQVLAADRRFSGVIFITTDHAAHQVLARRIPAIILNRHQPELPCPRVVVDDQQIGRAAAEHLLMRGHRHLCFLGDDLQRFSLFRRQGFEAAVVAALGEQARPVHLALGPDLERGLQRLPKPLGLMTGNDDWGYSAIAACRRAGLRIPDEVAIIGVDNDDVFGGEMTNPPLSSVAQRTDRIGYVGCEMLLRLIAGEAVPPLTLIPPGPVIVRQSTQAVAVDDELVAAAIRGMQQNLGRRIIVKELVDSLGVSRRVLELHFMCALQRTPGQELQRLRMERAKYLLATTRHSLGQIADLAGFASAARLTHAFRRTTGMTPGAYRQELAAPVEPDDGSDLA